VNKIEKNGSFCKATHPSLFGFRAHFTSGIMKSLCYVLDLRTYLAKPENSSHPRAVEDYLIAVESKCILIFWQEIPNHETIRCETAFQNYVEHYGKFIATCQRI
jgi:hypothetical protein